GHGQGADRRRRDHWRRKAGGVPAAQRAATRLWLQDSGYPHSRGTGRRGHRLSGVARGRRRRMIPAITLGKAEEEAYYRVITRVSAGTPLSGAGAARQGGRFNRPGQVALYLSTDEATALAEYKQDNPW